MATSTIPDFGMVRYASGNGKIATAITNLQPETMVEMKIDISGIISDPSRVKRVIAISKSGSGKYWFISGVVHPHSNNIVSVYPYFRGSGTVSFSVNDTIHVELLYV